MDIRELLSKLHLGHGSPDRVAGTDSAPVGEAFVDNALRLNEDEFGPIVPYEELEREFIEKEHARLHPQDQVSRAGLLETAPTLDSVEAGLLREYRAQLEELFGNPEDFSEAQGLVDQLEAEFTGEEGAEKFVPLWSPVDRERLTQAFETGGIDAVNEAFPAYGGLELPSGDPMDVWMKDRDLIEQLLPPEQIPVMESHNRLAYLNRLREAQSRGEGVPRTYVRSYRDGGGPFMRSGVNTFEEPLREGHSMKGGFPHYVMGQMSSTMQEMGAGSNSPSVTGLMNYMDYSPSLVKYNSQIRSKSPIAALQHAAGQAYQNQSNKIMFPYNEAIGTAQVQSPNYFDRFNEYKTNSKAFADSQPPSGVQQAHGSLEGPLNYLYGEGKGTEMSKDIMEGPYGNMIGFGFDMASELADLSPFGALGEGIMGGVEAAAGAASRIPMLRKLAIGARTALPEIVGEGIFDGVINTGAQAINLAGYGPPPTPKVEAPGDVEQRIQKGLDHMNTLVPLPQDKGITHFWNEEDNRLKNEMNKRRNEKFPVDRLMQNEPYRQDMWKSIQEGRKRDIERQKQLEAEKNVATPSFFPRITPM